MRHLPLLFLLLACGSPAPPPAAGVVVPATEVDAPAVVVADSVAGAAKPIDTLPPAPAAPVSTEKPRPKRTASARDAGCLEIMDGSSSEVRAVLYVRRADMAAREKELEDILASAWMLKQQNPQVSIADDFERGISTERVHRPETVDVRLEYFANCSAREPHTVQLYRVWRTPEGGTGWQER